MITTTTTHQVKASGEFKKKVVRLGYFHEASNPTIQTLIHKIQESFPKHDRAFHTKQKLRSSYNTKLDLLLEVAQEICSHLENDPFSESEHEIVLKELKAFLSKIEVPLQSPIQTIES